MTNDKSKFQSPTIRAKIQRLRSVSETLITARKIAYEAAREQARKEISLIELERDTLVRDLYALSQVEENRKGLSAAEIKRAMLNSNHGVFQGIVSSVDLNAYREPTDWTLEEPYLSDPWVISDWYGSIYSDAGAKFRLTRFYKYEDYVGQEIVVQRVAKDSVLIQSELVTLFDLSNATDPDRNLHPDFLDAALPGVPEDRRREIVQALTDHIAEEYGE